jgi:hypothetical protein
MKLNFLHIDKGDIKYDSAKNYLPFNIKRRVRKYLKNCTAHTLVATRESLYSFVNEVENPFIKNKVYFFHTDYGSLNTLFPGFSNELDKINYDKVVFVSKHNKESYNQNFNIKANKQVVIGNSLTSNKIIDRNNIKACGKKSNYKGICLLRLANDRIGDIDRIIEFGNYLKEQKCKKFIINVYGNGSAVNYFKRAIRKNKLSNIIYYKGLTDDPFGESQKHDFIIDFSINQSFGMIYLEGVLAGKKIYASSNGGSNEVLKKMKENIYSDFDDLYKKLNNIDKVTTDELVKYYDILLEDYGPQKVADEFINLIK